MLDYAARRVEKHNLVSEQCYIMVVMLNVHKHEQVFFAVVYTETSDYIITQSMLLQIKVNRMPRRKLCSHSILTFCAILCFEKRMHGISTKRITVFVCRS